MAFPEFPNSAGVPVALKKRLDYEFQHSPRIPRSRVKVRNEALSGRVFIRNYNDHHKTSSDAIASTEACTYRSYLKLISVTETKIDDLTKIIIVSQIPNIFF